MNAGVFCPVLLLWWLGSGVGGWAEEVRGGSEPTMIDLKAVVEEGQELVLREPTSAEVYRDRQARWSLGPLRRDRPVVVLAMDRHGLLVRGENRAGPVTGWIGWRQALGNDEAARLVMQRYFERLLVVERLIAQRQAAIGMSGDEIERAWGKASSRRVENVDGRQIERLEWISEQEVPLLSGLPGLAKDEALLTVTRETGRRSASLEHGVVRAIESTGSGKGGKIATVPAPRDMPFAIRPAPGRP